MRNYDDIYVAAVLLFGIMALLLSLAYAGIAI